MVYIFPSFNGDVAFMGPAQRRYTSLSERKVELELHQYKPDKSANKQSLIHRPLRETLKLFGLSRGGRPCGQFYLPNDNI